MKTRYLLLFIITLLPLASFAQLTSNLSIFSEDGDKFSLYLNGKLQNDKPLPEVRLEGLTEPYYDAKVVFEDKSLPDLYRKVQVVTPQGDPSYALYKIKQDKDGKLIIYFLSNVPLKEGLTANDNRAFNTYGRDVTKDYVDPYSNVGNGKGGGSTTIITSTTTTTTTTTSENNVAALTPDTQKPATQAAGTDESSANSSSAAAPDHASITPTDIEKGEVNPEPKHKRGRRARRAAEAAARAASDSSVEVTHLSGVNTTEPDEKKAPDENDTSLRAIMGAPPAAATAPAQTAVQSTVAVTTTTVSTNPADTVGRSNERLVEGPPNCQPLDSAAFSVAIQKITDADDEDAKLAAAKKVVDSNCVTTYQVVIMFGMISRDRLRLELGEYAYPRTSDPRQYEKVTKALQQAGNRSDLEDYINYVNNNR